MRSLHRARREPAQLVTDARRSKSEDISYRERRYLLMMGVRVVCFAVAVILFARGAGWVAAIPAIAAIVIPYFAVVFANGGREPDRSGRFRPYEPSLPVPYSAPEPGPASAPPGSANGQPGAANGQPGAANGQAPSGSPGAGDRHDAS